MPVTEIAGFVLFGLVVSVYGALVGAGGGFIIVPILLIFYHYLPEHASATSLAVVFVNAVSATLAFVRQRRIDYQTGWRFALATVPGAIIGAYVVPYFSSRLFNLLFGILLIVLAVFLNLRPDPSKAKLANLSDKDLPSGYVRRSLTDAGGQQYVYAFNLRNGIILSFFIGFLSSMLGIGGGIVHVPAMVFLFGFPAHLATATSQFALIFTSLIGSIAHFAQGNILLIPAAAMAVGGIAGAQLGAAIAHRVKGPIIVRFLSIALVVAGVRLIYGALF